MFISSTTNRGLTDEMRRKLEARINKRAQKAAMKHLVIERNNEIAKNPLAYGMKENPLYGFDDEPVKALPKQKRRKRIRLPEAAEPFIPEVTVTPSAPSARLTDIPGHTVDALGRYRPNYKKTDKSMPKQETAPILKDGIVSSTIERVEVTAKRIKRDGTFRQRVLGTYGLSCVMCGYSNYVEAAHLVPKHQVNDDRTENGAPLCPNHHWELDHGLITAEEVINKRDTEI